MHVETQNARVEVHAVAALLQNLGNLPGVVELLEVDVAARLLDGLTNQLGRARLTLCPDNSSLLLLACLVDDEGGALRFLLRDLLGFDGGGKFGREGEVLFGLSAEWHPCLSHHVLTVSDTSSSIMLKRAALRTRLSLTSLLTFSRWVMSWLALNCATTLLSTSLTIDGSTRSS